MSYAISSSLQTAVYQTLTNDAAVTGHLGSAIYDAIPAGTLPAMYLTLGSETVTDVSDGSGFGARHDILLSIVSSHAGFQAAKEAASSVCDALIDASLTLSRGRLVSLDFLRAVARRDENGLQRRIDLTFRAWVEECPSD